MVIAIVAITLAKLEFQKKGEKRVSKKKKITSQNFSYFSCDFFHKYITYEKWFHEILFKWLKGCVFSTLEVFCVLHIPMDVSFFSTR